MENFTVKSKTSTTRFEYVNESVNVNGTFNTNGEDVLTSLNGEVCQGETMIGSFYGSVNPSGNIIYNQSDVPSDKLELFRTTVSEVESAVLTERGGEA